MSSELAPTQEDPAVAAWERFLKAHYREEINEAVLKWPNQKSLVVSYFKLQSQDENLAQLLLDRPYEALKHAQEALKTIDTPGAELLPIASASRRRLRVRVVDLPEDVRLGLADLRVELTGRLVSINAVLQSVAPPVGKLQDALFICQRCGNAIRVPQDEHLTLQEPNGCYEDQGGCARDAKFKLIVGEHRGQRSIFIDTQVALAQEPPEGIVGTRSPVSVPCFIEDDLCGTVLPSDRVRINGVLRMAERRSGNKKTGLFDYYIEVNSVEPETQDYSEIEPTEDELAAFRLLAERTDLRDILVGSFAPTIYGMREVKLAILLQLFGGVPKDFADGRHIRGDIHVLVVGDPGVAKSVLGHAAARFSPRGQFVEALNATVPGLVGGVEKMDKNLSGEGWVYQAGIVSMCHRGFMALDEVDKAKEEKSVLPALLVPLEQQRATLAKHGARGIVVKCEFALLATANPKGGRFDPSADAISQIDVLGPFLDRMDLIFAIRDVPDETRDAHVSDTIQQAHAAGIALRRGEAIGEGSIVELALERDFLKELRAQYPGLPPAPVFLRKYIAHAKRSVFPVTPPIVRARIKSKYISERRKRSQDEDSPVGFSARMVDSMTRLVEAAARMRLAEEVSNEDLDFAAEIYNVGWEQLARNAQGRLDTDRLGSAPSFDQRESARLMKTIMREHPDGIRSNDLIAIALARGVARETATGVWDLWRRNSTVLELQHNIWVLVESGTGRPRAAPPPAPPAPSDENSVRWK